MIEMKTFRLGTQFPVSICEIWVVPAKLPTEQEVRDVKKQLEEAEQADKEKTTEVSESEKTDEKAESAEKAAAILLLKNYLKKPVRFISESCVYR